MDCFRIFLLSFFGAIMKASLKTASDLSQSFVISMASGLHLSMLAPVQVKSGQLNVLAEAVDYVIFPSYCLCVPKMLYISNTVYLCELQKTS
jgi:hypothetical protein